MVYRSVGSYSFDRHGVFLSSMDLTLNINTINNSKSEY